MRLRARNGTELVRVTTTSVGNSGLLDALLPAYEQTAQVRFGVHPDGSGRALAMLAVGDADVAISHAPEAEAKALAAHPRWWFRFAATDLSVVMAAVEQERQCCRFLQFDVRVEPDGGSVWLALSGPPGTQDFLRAMIED